MTKELPETFERWTSSRKASLVVSILKDEITIQEAARKYELSASEINEWTQKFMDGGQNYLRTRPREITQVDEDELFRAQRIIGELSLENARLKANSGRAAVVVPND